MSTFWKANGSLSYSPLKAVVSRIPRMTLCGTFPLKGLLISLEVAPLSRGIVSYLFGEFHVDGGIESHQTEIEGEFDVVSVNPDLFSGGIGFVENDSCVNRIPVPRAFWEQSISLGETRLQTVSSSRFSSSLQNRNLSHPLSEL